jgi:hypothetical protein
MKTVKEFQAGDISPAIDEAGIAVLTFPTPEGAVVIHTRRHVLESLAARIRVELERVPAPTRQRSKE